jgi:hypothetical protein
MSSNKIKEALRAFEKDPKFKRLKQIFPANTNLKKAVTKREGKKK